MYATPFRPIRFTRRRPQVRVLYRPPLLYGPATKPESSITLPIFGATGSDGQRSTKDVEDLATFLPDFQEQALYFEAIFQAVSEEPWVTGITIGIANWFNQF